MASLAASARALLLAGLLRFGAGEKELSDEDWEKINEEENEERVLKLNIIVLTVTILVAISLAFEFGHEHLLEHTSETMRPIVESLFSELTLLGFIGLTLFLVFKMAWLKELSEKLYGEENEITELGEAVHMVLFLIMVIFLAQAVLMAQMGERILSTWKTWEQRKIESFSPKAIVDAKSLSHASFFELIFIAGLPEHTRILLHALCRDRFIMAHRLNPADFEFASYLGIALGRAAKESEIPNFGGSYLSCFPLALGKTLAEIVEVPVKTWLQLEVVLLVFWQMDNVMDRSMRFVFWVFIGYSLLFVTFAVHAKIRQILLEHTAPLLTRAEARGGGAGLLKATKLLPPRRALSRSSPLKKKRESIRARRV
ncbi:hypothetical protein JL722_754 [Aureococcus anophagefferens]|nr:hypothetical protein JL722_754 [Aureococcus anophagefferens]